MRDPVLAAFLETAAEDVAACVQGSDILRLVPQPGAEQPPHTYDGCLEGVGHLVEASDGTVRVTTDPLLFTIHFPDDYCRSTDPLLQFRVVRLAVPVFHPNCQGAALCLGPHFRPGTRVRPLVEQLYAIVSGRIHAANDPLDIRACRYYLDHLDQVRALRARPLWRRPAAGRARLTWLRAPGARPGGER